MKHVAQKTRREIEAKTKEEAERQKLVKEEKKKKWLEYVQKLWNKVLAENATLLEGAKCYKSKAYRVKQ